MLREIFKFSSCLSLLLVAASYNLSAQTGPAGVQQTNGSSELVLWLDASTISASDGDDITTWSDLSGYGNHAYSVSGNRPEYEASWTNSKPAVQFTSSNSDYLYIDNASSLNLSQHQIYIVADMSSSSDGWTAFFLKTTDYDWDDGYGVVRYSSNETVMGFDEDYYYYGITSSISYNSPFMISHEYTGSRIRFRNGGSSAGSVNYSGGISNSSDEAMIGASPYYSGSITDYLDGNIAEIIVFDDNHNSVERILVQNYLASKYGISTSTDRYAYDSQYGNGLIGIGQRSGSSITTAQGQGILEISSPSSLGNNDYLLMAHDDGDLTTTESDAPDDFTYRMNRVWRSDVTNSPGTITLTFDVSGLGFPSNASDYAILIDDDGDFSDATIHTTGASYSGDEISFTGVSLSDGDYITLGILASVTWDGSTFENGSGTANAPNSSDSDRKFYVSGAGGSLSADASVRSMVVSGSGELTLNSNMELTIANGITNEGTITITDGSGLTQTHSGSNSNSGSGSYVIDRDGLGTVNGYNGLSSPIQSASIPSTFPSGNPCDMFLFDGDNQVWKYDYNNGYTADCLGNSVTFGSNDVISGGDGNMDVAKGYFIPGNSGNTKTFTGTINNGDITTPIYVEVNPSNVEWTGDDWNLVGNPYPGAIDATAFWNENAVNNSRISSAIYFWEDDATSGSGYNQNDDYASWNLLGGTSSSNSSETPNGYISSCQGFWVIATANTNLVFDNSMRGGTNTQFYKQESHSASARYWFSVENVSGDYNQLLVGFTDDATDGVDPQYDALKHQGNPDLYMGSVLNNDVYGIQAIPSLTNNESKEIPLELYSNTVGLHYFKLDSTHITSGNYKIMLIDKWTSKTHDIENGVAALYLDSAGTYENRFYLGVSMEESNNDGGSNGGGQTTSIDENNLTNNVFAYYNNGRITVNMTGINSKAKTLNLTSLSGTTVFSQDGSGNDIEYINTNDFAAGIYILNIEHESGNSTSKKISIIE